VIAKTDPPLLCVMIGDKQGEIGRLVRQHRCGLAITPGVTVHRVATAIRALMNGRAARTLLARLFSHIKLRLREAQPWRWLVRQTLQYAGPRGASLTATNCLATSVTSRFGVTGVTASAAI
jgi:hypothetical protein